MDSPPLIPIPAWVNADSLANWAEPSSSDSIRTSYLSLGWRLNSFASLYLQQSDGGAWPADGNNHICPRFDVLLNAGVLRPDVLAEQVQSDRVLGTVGMVAVWDGAGRSCYRINRLLADPAGGGWSPTWGSHDQPLRSIYVHPYAWRAYLIPGHGEQSRVFTNAPDLQRSRWIAVIDKFGSYEDITNEQNTYDSEVANRVGLLNRRVVEMNAPGYVLRDRTVEYQDGEMFMSGGGLGEQYIYKRVDEYFAEEEIPAWPFIPPEEQEPGVPSPPPYNPVDGLKRELLLVEHRSVGWSAGVNSSGEESPGLLRKYDYEFVDVVGEWTGSPAERLRLVAESIQKGNVDGGPAPLYTRQVFSAPDPYAEVTVDCQVEFNEPGPLLTSMPAVGATSPANGFPHRATFTITYRHVPTEEHHPSERRVIARMVVGPPRQMYPGSTWFYPVEREIYDEGGNPTWSVTGLLADPELPGANSLDTLVLTYYDRDQASGWTIHTVADASPGHLASPVVENGFCVPEWPLPWRRLPEPIGLNYVTTFGYSVQDGLTDTYFPNGRRWAKRVIAIPDPEIDQEEGVQQSLIAREFIFNDLVYRGDDASQNPLFSAEGVCEIRDYARLTHMITPRRVRRVIFENDIPIHPGGLHALDHSEETTDWTELVQVRLAIDANGRVAKADMLERDPTGALLQVGTRETNELGEVLREREIDGTITRTTRSPIGQPLRRYVGTIDTGFGAEPGESNMVLVERTEYGAGVTDAWLPTITRRYDHHPSWDDDDPYGVPPTNDEEGIATVTTYDWRMRPVRVDLYGKGIPEQSETPRLATTLTYLDHLDRPVMTVSYGAGGPSVDELPTELEPSKLDASGYWPDIEGMVRAFYDLPVRPVSIATMRYGPDGTLNERRSYNVAWQPPSGGGGDPEYLAEYSYAGQGGVEVFAQRPGQPITLKTLDGVGRVVSTKSVVPRDGIGPWEYEIARTDVEYDGDGNVVESIRWERVIEDAAAVLGPTNAVRSRTLNWFDIKKRLIATADLGSEQPQDQFISGTSSYQRPANPPTSTTPLSGMPPYAQISLYEYDRAGNQARTVQPGGLVTAYEFSSTGRMTRKVENPGDPGGAQRRVTDYGYQYGRLVSMSTDRAPLDQTTKPQRTDVVYGADIVDGEYAIVSRNNGLIGRMYLPTEGGTYSVTQDGERPKESLSVTLRYNFGGQVAERIDARGVVQRYTYDDQGRLSAVQIGRYDSIVGPNGQQTFVFKPAYPASMTPAGQGAPVDRIGYVSYSYDARGGLQDIIARTVPSNQNVPHSGAIIAHNRYTRDLRGSLLTDYQSHGAAVNLTMSPRTEYLWEYIPTGTGTASDQLGSERLTRVTYPAQPGYSVRRQVNLSYGAEGSIDDLLSRVTGITSNVMPYAIADFAYVGVSRRAGVQLAGGQIKQSFAPDPRMSDPPVGLPGLDAFGRVRDLHYRNAASTPLALFRGQYTYDLAGNRTSVLLTQASVGGSGGSRDNTHSQVNRYDGLNRLVGTDVGPIVLDSQTGMPVPHLLTGQPYVDTANLVRSDAWQLDLLGNWVGQGVSGATGTPGGLGAPAIPSGITDDAGRITFGQLDVGIPGVTPDTAREFRALTHLTNEQNELRAITLQEGDPDSPPSPPNPQQAFTRRDPNGNLIADGEYYYQYDAWGRIIQINRVVWTPTLANPPPTPGPDEPEPVEGEFDYSPAPGLLVKHYTYDGLGRLIRTQSPFPDVEVGNQEKNSRSERFYYDGIRRIQEVVTDPVVTTEKMLSSGEPELEALALEDLEETGEEEVDLKAASLKVEAGLGEMAGYGPEGAGGGGSGGGGTGPLPSFVVYVAREYVWGPGDSHSGVDELLVQFDQNRWAWWAIQDAGGDVVALCDMNGPGQKARVVGQWRYDAYGAATASEHLAWFPQVHCGHKALFFDRLDVGVADSQGNEPPRLIPYAHLIVHMRNRAYSPQNGRFMQPDPNATALTLIEATAYHGRGLGALVGVLDVESLYADGMNVYQYLGANPWQRSDLLGLSWVDDYEGVILNVVSTVDSFLPIPILAPVIQLLDGYNLLIRTAGFVQGAAFDAEEHLDWALDWDASDDDNPRFSSYGGFGDEVVATELRAMLQDGGSDNGPAMALGGFKNAVRVGKAGERQAVNSGKMRIGRKTSDGWLETTHGKGRNRRHYDGVDTTDANKMIEVKVGNQGVTERIRRQITKDAALINKGQKKVKWILYSHKGKSVNQDLVNTLKNHGIEVEVVLR